jgi:hypothetical protein
MSLVQFETKMSVFRSPLAQFQARLTQFSKHEIDNMTVKEFEALAFRLGSPMGGAGLFDLIEQKVLDHIFTDPAYAPPTTLYVAMSSTTPTEAAGSITEPSTGGYARLPTVSSANANPDWSAASGTAPAQKVNTATFTYAQASADWVAGANLTNAIICGSLAGVTTADFIAFGALATAKPVLNGDTASFAASAITMQMGDPGDTY